LAARYFRCHDRPFLLSDSARIGLFCAKAAGPAVSLDISSFPSYESSGLRTFSEKRVREWETKLKTFTSSCPTADYENIDDDSINPDPNSVHTEGLQPLLLPEQSLSTLKDSVSVLGENPSRTLLLDTISPEFPLNFKQRLVAGQIISEALAWKDHPFDSTKRDQSLMHTSGEGGTGKTRIIKAMAAIMSLLDRQHEIMLMAPTGCAADNIDGNTYHTSLGMSIGRKPNKKPSERIQRLWARKTIMVIDEISMMDLATLANIDRYCKSARSLSTDSSELFGGIPMDHGNLHGRFLSISSGKRRTYLATTRGEKR